MLDSELAPYGNPSALAAPATKALAVTPHDSNALTEVPKALYVGTGGNITMRGVNGAADQLWKNVPAGTILPFRAQYIRATGTTAADILALY
jgi:type 1 fimbria pilin